MHSRFHSHEIASSESAFDMRKPTIGTDDAPQKIPSSQSSLFVSVIATLFAITAGTATANSFASPRDSTKRIEATQPRTETKNFFTWGALENFYEGLDARRAETFKSTGLKVGAFHSTLFQYATRSLPDQDKYGVATITGLYGTWDAVEIGDASAGQISFGLEARWGYGNTLTPSELGIAGIGSAIGTADPYGATTPTLVLRELFWRQGSEEKGWNYRIGKITPDRLLTASDYIDPVSLGLPVGSQGASAIAFPDSGLGFAAGWFPSKRYRVGIVVSDAAGDRTDLGDVGQGNFFKGIEFQAQLFPLTEKAGYSSLAIWHTDGTDDPSDALDSSTGEDGWGFFAKYEQELTRDGKNIFIARYGKSYDDAAVYKEQGSIRYVRIDPPDPFGLSDDRFGIAASFVDPLLNPLDRDEWGIDAFYRFNLFERVEASFGYQAIFDPSFNPDDDTISVFSFRISQFF
ncbi:hypothetical protein AVO44_08350 [Ruegeria profundi]|uniref:Porin n=2 Tax=Ruegeria profundi TaxID=1685378 RepID=A0A0X3TU70_9RHOB|nr:hypothetical protein AVO44_08350 [Ruegeria profundi]